MLTEKPAYRCLNPLRPYLAAPASRRSATNDLWAAILFICVTGFALYRSCSARKGSTDHSLVLGFACGVAGLISLMSFAATQALSRSPKLFYRVACGTLATAVAVLCWRTRHEQMNKESKMGQWIIFGFGELVVLLLYYFGAGNDLRIQLQKMTSQTASRFRFLHVIDFSAMVLCILYMYYAVELINVKGWYFALYIFAVFWFCSVANNFTKAVSTGLAARIYFGFDEDAEDERRPDRQLKLAGAESIVCALKAFGSICLGSLITTAASLASMLVRLASEATAEDKVFVIVIKAMIRALAYMVESFVQRFNRYSLTYVAITGKPYLTGAQQTQRVMKEFPMLEQAVWGQTAIPSIITSLFFTTIISGATALVYPTLVPLVAALSIVGVHSSVSAIHEGIPTATFVCKAETRLKIDEVQPPREVISEEQFDHLVERIEAEMKQKQAQKQAQKQKQEQKPEQKQEQEQNQEQKQKED